MAVQCPHIRYAGPGGRDLVGDLAQLHLISRMELLMCGHAGIIALSLKLLLVGKVLVHIVQQEFDGGIQSGAALTFSAGIQQGIDGVKQLPMLSVNDRVSGFQLFRQFISHSRHFLSWSLFDSQPACGAIRPCAQGGLGQTRHRVRSDLSWHVFSCNLQMIP